jgi:hypothetical protein
VTVGSANAIRQLRIRGNVEMEQLAQFPAPGRSDKPTMRVQVREQEGGSTPWIPASVVWLRARPLPVPSLLVSIDAVISLSPPSSKQPEYHEVSTAELRQRVAKKKKAPSKTKGQPKPTKPQREARNAAIREARRKGAKHDQLAADFHMSRSSIGKICNGLQPD